jgi:voltage-gated potassium channel
LRPNRKRTGTTGDGIDVKGAVTRLAYYSAPLRRFGASALARFVILVIGLAAMTAFTVPRLAESSGNVIVACLWGCLAYFAVEGLLRAVAAFQAGQLRNYLLSPTGLIDLIAVLPVPIALACGGAPSQAWLLGSFWVLKLAHDSPGLAQLGRVFMIEATALASVLTLFLIVLFLSAVAMHVMEGEAQPAAFGTLPASLWWAVVTLTTTGYGDEVPKSYLGHLLGAFVMICGIATFGLWTGILATGFAAESRRRNFLQTWNLVSKVPFFQALDPAAIAEITHMLRRLELPARTLVIRRGRVGDCMYFIAAGEVAVEVKPTPVRLGAGAFFGELALLGDSIRTANVSTSAPSTLLILDLADFRTITARHPELARSIDAEANRRMSENQRVRERQLDGGVSS